eukprot:scaffold103266_cov66-Phaeocystis_antarctica.AAC.6
MPNADDALALAQAVDPRAFARAVDPDVIFASSHSSDTAPGTDINRWHRPRTLRSLSLEMKSPPASSSMNLGAATAATAQSSTRTKRPASLAIACVRALVSSVARNCLLVCVVPLGGVPLGDVCARGGHHLRHAAVPGRACLSETVALQVLLGGGKGNTRKLLRQIILQSRIQSSTRSTLLWAAAGRPRRHRPPPPLEEEEEEEEEAALGKEAVGAADERH